MSIQINTPGLHHIALRTTDLPRSKKFYHELLGFPLLLEIENLFIVGIGNFALAIKGPEPSTLPSDKFSPFRVGLDHLALAASDEKEVDRVASQLKENNVWIEGPR
ncbi:MAG: VOC family protein [Cyclobacteriaceae bacterium]